MAESLLPITLVMKGRRGRPRPVPGADSPPLPPFLLDTSGPSFSEKLLPEAYSLGQLVPALRMVVIARLCDFPGP